MSCWRRLVVMGACLLWGCTVPSLDDVRAGGRGFSVEVNYTPTFKSGCIKVQAQDEVNAENVSAPAVIAGDVLGSMTPPMRLGVLHQWSEPPYDVSIAERGMERWSPLIKVVITAFEHDCGGKVVDQAELVVDVSGEGRKPSQSMVLVTPDADGDGYVARGEGGKGGTDCADTGPNAEKRFPGNPEVCDEVDNNCDSQVDEGFAQKGSPCSEDVCQGTFVCNPVSKTVMCSARPPRLYYPDADRDGDGDLHAAATKVCEGAPIPQGFVESLHSDCDEADPSTFGAAQELCDAVDNNCSGGADEGLSCRGSLKRVSDYHLSSVAQSWKTVATGESGYPVWVAGAGGKLAVRKAPGQKFESFSFGDPSGAPPDGSPAPHSTHCGNHDWTVSWVSSKGWVFLGGTEGWLALHTGDPALDCSSRTTPPRVVGQPSPHITGMVGFEEGDRLVIYLSDAGGRYMKWEVGGSPPVVVLVDDSGASAAYGLHGLREHFQYMGGGGAPGGQGIWAVSDDPAPGAIHCSMEPGTSTGAVRAVWMGADNSVCAVGDGGVAWRRHPAAVLVWTRAPPSPGGSANFSSVVMRYDKAQPLNPVNEQCYVVDSDGSGQLRRWTPFGWAKDVPLPATANVPLRDLAMNPTGSDFWLVGDQGRVFHYPEP
ncbi:BNR repeat domain protein [Myxococcus stipitatus DSM 14675]|uniref:BNR repeat domain protein n=1 Tax=Myxococcus stipitatus (strain DSM 14675 / JCM 12634 / Mx s8) TaxID=1278073 RepID=L7TZR7_MYXSD|nr:putative metal-binding motif-containing protein [Myxococcus stipitatus]AGC41468.1 BNR repeat domain protein [Myxococcus stipitatus DSM 14675]